MLSRIFSPFKKIIYKNIAVRAFVVTRLKEQEIEETVILQSGTNNVDISRRHSIICLDPFCVAIWPGEANLPPAGVKAVTMLFKKGNKTRARLKLTLIENIIENGTTLLLFEAVKAQCFQLNPLYRFLTLFFFLKNKTSSYRERKFIAALYSYPRKVIIVSYREEGYCNIFPMDIQGYIAEGGMYVLGLRTTNITLQKILAAKKLVICNTHMADVDIVYSLGKHLSVSPPPVSSMPFKVSNSKLFEFPVPEFSSAYKEVEIIRNRKMGYHMLLLGKIVSGQSAIENPGSLYHLHIMQFVDSGYNSVSAEIY